MATIEIDGKKFETDNGKMIIEVADEAGIHIPRFCYHKKLSIAANCRMCLVQVENGRKPVPACATPIADGMKVFTKSEETLRSQKAVMEFLLINHPLDCPVCDQGGECELQDLSMGFGYDESEYDEKKRSVEDDNLGPLIATEMTRCIHCTRCVRFGTEIAGIRELGGTYRGEKMQIGTFVQHSMTSEVSANIIDLCPVGALTSKPSRFHARPWELNQYESVSPHDCLGSNVYLHVRRKELIRVVPKENEHINETWLSDRDRFSYLSLKSQARLAEPMIKTCGQWQTVDWPTALKFAADGMARIIKQHGPEQFGALGSASSTVEELYLLQKLMREMGVNNIDYRTRQTDFRDECTYSVSAVNSMAYQELESMDTVLVLGSHLIREVPLAAVRLRKAWQNGAKVFAINPVDYDLHLDVTAKAIVSPCEIAYELIKLFLALDGQSSDLPDEMHPLLIGWEPDTHSKMMANGLKNSKSVIITGEIFENHPDASLLRALLHHIISVSGAKRLHLSSGANANGAELAGMLPHRLAFGRENSTQGIHVQKMIEKSLKGYFLLGLEPGFDFANPHDACKAVLGAEFVILMSAFHHESMHDYANVILPIAPFSETSGTFINVDGTWQSFKGACQPYMQSRPAWKILRVLGNLLQCKHFEYNSSEEVLEEVKNLYRTKTDIKYQPVYPETLRVVRNELVRVGEWPLYRSDAMVRNTQALQNCAASDPACIRMHPKTADRMKLNEVATVSQGDIEITLPLKRDGRIAPDVVWVPNGLSETTDLGHSFAAINIK